MFAQLLLLPRSDDWFKLDRCRSWCSSIYVINHLISAAKSRNAATASAMRSDAARAGERPLAASGKDARRPSRRTATGHAIAIARRNRAVSQTRQRAPVRQAPTERHRRQAARPRPQALAAAADRRVDATRTPRVDAPASASVETASGPAAASRSAPSTGRRYVAGRSADANSICKRPSTAARHARRDSPHAGGSGHRRAGCRDRRSAQPALGDWPRCCADPRSTRGRRSCSTKFSHRPEHRW